MEELRAENQILLGKNMKLKESELVLTRDNEEQRAECQNLQAERVLQACQREGGWELQGMNKGTLR